MTRQVRFLRTVFLIGILLVPFSCAMDPEPIPLPGQAMQGDIVARYRVVRGPDVVGYLLEISFAEGGPERRYVVLNSFRQEVGFIDRLGRAYRYELPDGKPKHVSTATMEKNLRAVLGISEGVTVLPDYPEMP